MKTSFLLYFFTLVLVTLGYSQSDTVNQRFLKYDVESQVPCFIFGGYHLSLGIAHENLRFRAEIQNSGNMNFGQFGLTNKNENFGRYVDNFSVGINADYYLRKWFFTSISLQSRNWLITNIETLDEANFRTFDAGVGLGVQFFPFKQKYLDHLFFQISGVFYFRQKQTISIESINYTISSVDILPGVRIGLRF
jgi:hypothetical protein